MNYEIIKIDSSDFGIEKEKANQLIGNLPQLIDERSEYEKQYNEVIKLDIEDAKTTKKAKELRLKIRSNRTKGINVWHKTTKDYFLRGGQFVDAIKRKEVAVNERMEENLEEIEKHAEIKERQRLIDLQHKRAEQISPYVEDADERDLSSMDEDIWEAYFSTKKQAYESEQERLRKEEKDRIAKEKAEAEERKRIAEENERLRKEAEKREKIEREERAKREKLEAELKAKQEAELKAKQDEEARLQAELKKGDSQKIEDLKSDLLLLKEKYKFKAKAYKETYTNVGALIDKVVNYINENK